MGHTHRYKFGFKKKSGKESQYMVSYPELGSDLPIGLELESGCDRGNLLSLQNPLNLSESMISYHWIPSPNECWRMMCYKPLEVTKPPLTTNCTSLCNGSSCSTHGLNKGLPIKHGWSASRLTPSSPSSTCHLHMSNRKVRFLSLYSISSTYATTNIHHTYFPYTIY